MIHWEGMENEIRKIYQKGQGIKGQFAYFIKDVKIIPDKVEVIGLVKSQ
ncbi:MAG: hypothetical protein ACMUEL_03560 [Flavobacteriales bacterium Tduv]